MDITPTNYIDQLKIQQNKWSKQRSINSEVTLDSSRKKIFSVNNFDNWPLTYISLSNKKLIIVNVNGNLSIEWIALKNVFLIVLSL